MTDTIVSITSFSDAFCPVCDADRFPAEYHSEERTSPCHYAVRFGEADRMVTPFIAGRDATDWHIEECMVGADGWAIQACTQIPSCWNHPGQSELKRRVIRGSVAVERRYNVVGGGR